ncbi:uncharacterized protein gpsm1a isoform X2 [Oryzias latipes]
MHGMWTEVEGKTLKKVWLEKLWTLGLCALLSLRGRSVEVDAGFFLPHLRPEVQTVRREAISTRGRITLNGALRRINSGTHSSASVSDSPDRSTLHSTNSTRTIMAEKEHSSLSSTAPTAHKSRRTGGAGLKCSPKAHYSSSPGLGDPSKPSASPLRALAGLVPPAATSGSEGRSGSSRPRGQSLGSAPNSRNKSTPVKRKLRSNQQGEAEALLDLILESQSQRLDDQRASLSLLPDRDAASLCGACSSDQALDFYCMLIHYQSDRMEDQRCSLPDLD